MKCLMNIIKNKMKLGISKSGVKTIYKVNEKIKTDNKPRYVIVRCINSWTKMEVYQQKKMPKGWNIVVKENMTAFRLKAVTAASKKYWYKNRWKIGEN